MIDRVDRHFPSRAQLAIAEISQSDFETLQAHDGRQAFGSSLSLNCLGAERRPLRRTRTPLIAWRKSGPSAVVPFLSHESASGKEEEKGKSQEKETAVIVQSYSCTDTYISRYSRACRMSVNESNLHHEEFEDILLFVVQDLFDPNICYLVKKDPSNNQLYRLGNGTPIVVHLHPPPGHAPVRRTTGNHSSLPPVSGNSPPPSTSTSIHIPRTRTDNSISNSDRLNFLPLNNIFPSSPKAFP